MQETHETSVQNQRLLISSANHCLSDHNTAPTSEQDIKNNTKMLPTQDTLVQNLLRRVKK